MQFISVFTRQLLVLVLVSSSFAMADDREWSDIKGHHKFKAKLIAQNKKMVVLQKEDDELVTVKIEELSKEDIEYLKSQNADEAVQASADSGQSWTLKNGTKVNGKVIDYVKRDVKIHRDFGKTYVNDQVYKKMPEIYREKIIPQIVAHFEKTEIDGEDGLQGWLIRQSPQSKTYHCEGVLFELDDGNRYSVPFFFFADKDQEALKAGWNRWVAAADDKAKQDEEKMYLRAQAQTNTEQLQQLNQVAQMQLHVSEYNAGLFDLWNVALSPPNGSYAMRMNVVVPGRSSREAANAALQKYPGYVVNGIAKVRRRGRGLLR